MTCDQCGARVNEGDAFCGECGAFLDWSAPRPARAAADPDPPPADPTPARDPEPADASPPEPPPAGAHPEPNRDPEPANAASSAAPPPPPEAPQPPQADPTPAPGSGPVGASPPAPPRPPGVPADGARPAPETPHAPSGADEAPASGVGAPSADPADDSDQDSGARVSTAAAPDDSPQGDSDGDSTDSTAGGAADDSAPDSGSEAGKAAARAAALLAPTPTGTPRPRARPRDRSTEAPAARTGRPTARPVAVQPGREAVRRPQVGPAADGYAEAPDDVACGECGTANPAGRSFCRRCGLPLRPPDADARLSWWRRLWRRLRGRRSRRRGPAGRFRRPLTRLLLLAALAAIVLAAIGYGPRLVDRVRERFTEPQSVRPAAVEASSAAADHPVDLAVDGTWNRFWAPVADEEPAGQWLEASFEKEFRLTELVVHSGSSDRTDEYLTQARPASLTVTAWNTEGEQVGERTVTLEDRPGEQVVDLTMDDVATLRLTIGSAYGHRPTRLVALGEVEFFTRG
ncbi:hypothetical protein [Streptomyces sp. B6B3]|uniref:NADase-type glycan-binding domain-containing protein n=1 Tax=Streptomyces sp. B6B3 TaxID=3153570 RepID=UPI00325E2A5D